ncbi:MAG: epoxyqueuosine reductase QueH [Clostridia bacterium]|nr:epoxyqueuosine reductase QueH [Clostridia bacterium]
MKQKQKILLHSCCAPCSTAVIERLKDDYEIVIFYYNPNIYPEEEYIKRKNEEIKYIAHLNETNGENLIEMLDCDYDSEKFYEATRGYEKEREGGARCAICFKLRLEETAKKAKEKGFDLFGTTLTVSPHKNAELINSIGLGIEKELDIKFLVSNFKKQNGYKRSVELSKENNIYRQSYCGCEFALNIQKIEAPESLKKVY